MPDENKKTNWKMIALTSVVFPVIVGTVVALINVLFTDSGDSVSEPKDCTKNYDGWNEHACGVLTGLNLHWGQRVDDGCVSSEPGPKGNLGRVLHRPTGEARIQNTVLQPHQVELWFNDSGRLVEVDLKTDEDWKVMCHKVEEVLKRKPDNENDRVCIFTNSRGTNNPVKSETVTVAKGKNDNSVVRAVVVAR